MEAWVIKRDDGKYLDNIVNNRTIFMENITDAKMYRIKNGAILDMDFILRNYYKFGIEAHELKVCKIRIEEVEENE